MPFPMTQKRGLLAGAAVVAILGGCATPPPDMPEPVLPEYERSMEVGVSYIQPTSDIVIMDASYQHVVLPDGARVAYRPGWEDQALALVAEGFEDGSTLPDPDKRRIIGPNSDDVRDGGVPPRTLADVPAASESDDPVYRAWRKLCDMEHESMTDEEMQLVLNHPIPAVLRGLCDEAQRWLGELK